MFLNDTIDQLDIIDIYRTLHPKPAEYTSHSSAHRMPSRLDHFLGHKTSLNRFKMIEIISSIFFWPNGIKLEISYRKKNGKRTNTWRLNNTLLKNKWTNEEIKEEIRKYLGTNENGNTSKFMGCCKNNSKRNVYKSQVFLKKQEKSQIKILTYHLKELEREMTQINKIRNEIGEITINTTEIQKLIREYYE